MTYRLSDATKNLIVGFNERGLSAIDIVKRAGVSYPVAFAIAQGFSLICEHHEDLAKTRQKRDENKELSVLVRRGLQELGKTQSQLARQLGTSRQTIHYIINGTSILREKTLKKLLDTLNLNNFIESMEQSYS